MARERQPARRLSWEKEGRRHDARSATPALVEEHKETLAAWYNAPRNAEMMGGSGTMTPDDVLEFYASLADEGGVGMLAFVDGDLVGDMDLRGFAHAAEGEVAEFAIMIGDERRKGQGLGRTFAAMLHVHAFRDLGLARLYVPPRETNVRVHALNDFLGYVRDESERARAFADEAGCLTSSLDARSFAARHPEAWRDVVLSREEPR